METLCQNCNKYTKDLKGHQFTCPKNIKRNIEYILEEVVKNINNKSVDEEKERIEFMKSLSTIK